MQRFRDFTGEKQEVRRAVEDYLLKAFLTYPETEVQQAARYAVLGVGHRWRAIVKRFGPEADWMRSLACEVSWKAY